MIGAKVLTVLTVVGSIFILNPIARAEATARHWTHEFDELTDGSSTDSGESAQEAEALSRSAGSGSWDQFLLKLPNSKFIQWALSWSGVSPYEKNSEPPKAMSPASVQKILTSTTALRVLGSDFRFANAFEAQLDSASNTVSKVEFSVSGDPTWAHPAYGEKLMDRMNLVIDRLKQQGVQKVVGPVQVVLNQPGLANFTRPEQWKQSWLLECYATLPTAVTLNGNCATFRIASTNQATWTTTGVSTPLDVRLSKSTHNSVEITPVLDDYGRVAKYQIRGGFSSPSSFSVPVQNNETWLKNLFTIALKSAGIAYDEAASAPESASENGATIPLFVDLSSKPLREILPPFLQQSINLIADRLYLEVAYRLGSSRMDEPELQSLSLLLEDPNATDGVVAFDGSGLIAADQLPAKTLRRYLEALRTQPYFSDFLQGLPVAGKSGTMRSRLTGSLTSGRVFAKTGTIDGVANLAGYYLKADSTYEPFVIFTHSNLAASTVRAQMDKLVTEFARQNTSLRISRKP